MLSITYQVLHSLRTYAVWQKSRWIFAVVFGIGLLAPSLILVRVITHSYVSPNSGLVQLCDGDLGGRDLK